ncbi:ribbon-helix-helix protein, CopG family [Candidatus Daviesbacteria bacterium]|nr:ribbon-helix-helix protein, CopG family [Candidatus Daviesbacteria bacterium]
MSTITISLPVQIAKKVDTEAKKQGFASRSEFIRSLLRKYFSFNKEELKFEPFVPRPLAEIETELRQTGKYNEKFIRSVIRGLRDNSSFYAHKTS